MPRQAYSIDFAPNAVKQLIIDVDIPQGVIAEALGCSRALVNLVINKDYTPPQRPRIRQEIASLLASGEKANQVKRWLTYHHMRLEDVWRPLGKPLRKKHPRGTTPRGNHTRMSCPAVIPGNPDDHEEEKQMRKVSIPEQVLKHYGFFRDPFRDDPRSEKEVYRSDNHRFLEYAMRDAAENSALLAIVAEVGAGKTVMRREVIEDLRRDERVRIIFPRIIDKKRVSARSLCDAIVYDLSPDEKIKNSLEAKARQVEKLLIERVKNGVKVCMIIEEAHDLNVDALKYLKRFYELELGRQKMLGIILLGQTELGNKLDEEQYPDLREFIRRVQIACISGLDGVQIWDYLRLKFSIVAAGEAGRKDSAIDRVITREAVDALGRRLTIPGDRGKAISIAYPLTLNNYMANAMVLAHDMGEAVITADVINAL